MLKNVSGQFVGCQMITAADGTLFSGSVTVSVTGDNGTQATGSVGSGACTHEGGGWHSYAPAQAETNYSHVAFTFTGTGAIPASVQIYPLPTTGILAPTTLGRTLDVSSGGEAGIDWANVGSPTTTLNLSGTTVKTLTDAPADSGGTTTLLSRLTSTRAGYLDNISSAPPSSATIAAAVRDVNNTSPAGSSLGAAVNSAAAGGDPWDTSVPGAYAAGKAGYILGTLLDAAVSTRSTYAGADTSGTTTLLSRLSSTRAGYLDNLNTGVPCSDKTGFKLAADGVDLVVVETGLNLRQAISITVAGVAGVLSGAGTSSITIKGAGVATTRISATCDGSGNRTGITLNSPV